MLIRFRVNNFLSFREQAELSMIPGKTQKHPNHIVKEEGPGGIDILRSAIIYGANASGKSNLVKAMKFACALIIEGTKPNQSIPFVPFKLDPASVGSPSTFEFEFKQGIKNYIYGFKIDPGKVGSEWLYEIKKITQSKLFERTTDSENRVHVTFGLKKISKKETEFINFVAMGTRPNQLFLTECIYRNVSLFQDAVNWFKNVTIIFPESKFNVMSHPIETKENIIGHLVGYLENFDTGVCGFQEVEFNLESELPKEIVADIERDSIPGTKGMITELGSGQRYTFAKGKQGEIQTYKLMLKHKSSICQEEILFSMSEESDGTLRLFDLIPVLLGKGSNNVFVIDELDRSLHPTLSYQLFQRFLEMTNDKTQMIATTHETHLLDLDLLRRDEICFIEKDRNGASSLYSLEEFAPRYDKDIRKGYLLGRFGAIPFIGDVKYESDEK